MKNIILLIVVIQLPINIKAQINFTGTIKDNYAVLADASIFNERTHVGTISDTKGNFSIEAKKNDTLSISYVGYKRISLILSNFKHQDITLEVDNALEAILVVAQPMNTTTHTIKCNLVKCEVFCWVKGVKIEHLNGQVEENLNVLYPNPSKTGDFKLEIDIPFTHFEVEVYTITGQLVLSRRVSYFSKRIDIDLSSHPKGIYIINYLIDGKRQTPKKAIIG
ncbi:carboxypeptidase-like regulatory domain-containing protein [Flavobacteriaceae bacterium S0825]|uniref:T9SS type A sorting domain-containing protein n=1 Tax=Gaetbulibacter sp. S0825 TaxID=2720084 RepID=UPI001431C5CD|nr:T9SS type A sorting domain-containing protein [Gaetbulibacter sp. S0825]MCK0108621.1 carboxypeptidase-like regulatory domain-containing protein [Flavobacteriaceae bacterium S0825]NIX64257.1 T9SS type A sorting domain-containing protein [Gaetbulibacter sp. S0825]